MSTMRPGTCPNGPDPCPGCPRDLGLEGWVPDREPVLCGVPEPVGRESSPNPTDKSTKNEVAVPRLGYAGTGSTLIVALGGWNDAGHAASVAGSVIADVLDVELVEGVDPDDYFDYHLVRPRLVPGEGTDRILQWPSVELHVARAEPADGRRVYLMTGEEPSHGWRRLTRKIFEWVETHGVDRIVMLGAMLANTPHTKPVPVMVTSESRVVRNALQLEPNDYIGVVGILSALSLEARQRDVVSLALWAYVPFYCDTSPAVKAALALVDALDDYCDIQVDRDTLREKSRTWEAKITAEVDAEDTLRETVRELERGVDDGESPYFVDSEVLSAQLEAYLRSTQGPDER